MPEQEYRGSWVEKVILVTAAVVFVAALVTSFLPATSRHPHDARRMNCASNLRQLGLAIKQYAQDNDEAFPPDLGPLYPVYVDGPKVFSCPHTPSKWRKIERNGRVRPEWTSYVYVAGLTNEDDAACVLAHDRHGNHGGDGANVLFLDTHVEWVPSLERLAELLAKTRALAAAKGHTVKLVGE